MLISGYVSRSILSTGIVIATSPIAEKRITSICFDGESIQVICFSIQDSTHHHYTFSSVYRLSYTFSLLQYLLIIAVLPYLDLLFVPVKHLVSFDRLVGVLV